MNELAEKQKLDVTDTVFLNDVYKGLEKTQKTLPCKYLYDDWGSLLFEKITELEEYYLTRAELAILDNHIDDIASQLGSNTVIIEPGCGAGRKIQKLLSAVEKPKTFVPFEISDTMLDYSVSKLSALFPELNIQPLLGDFTRKDMVQQIISTTKLNESSNVVFFPGSTIGNFSKHEVVEILTNFKYLSGINGKILIGIDLIKEKDIFIRAYNDLSGITAEFNKNILKRINTHLDGNFDVQNGFHHTAEFNEDNSRIEMHLVSSEAQTVCIADRTFYFKRCETIHTESSHKYSIESFSNLANQAGLELEKHWINSEHKVALCLLSG